jgi:hypothetical protein
MKKLFCKHVWKDEEKTFLFYKGIRNGGTKYGCPPYSNYKFYGVRQRCLKCDKNKYIKKSVVIV